ncbi:23S ribosomal RNA methyltransferase Erm [Allosaccharopolyspora coralli]
MPGGREELGQNFLVSSRVIGTIVDLVARTAGPVVELGAGDGAVTLPLSRGGRSVTAVEIDPRRVRRLRRTVPEHVAIVQQDMLRYRPPRHPHVLVANLPFHLTTSVLRRVLAQEHWTDAVLLVQWEVARRRAGVGGASLMTASWWPWYEFAVVTRVPAEAFRPVPSVDGGLLTVTRRKTPLVVDRVGYQRFVRDVFTGRGRGVSEVVTRTGWVSRPSMRAWMGARGLRSTMLPKDLTAEHWASLWALATEDALSVRHLRFEQHPDSHVNSPRKRGRSR